MVTVPSSEFQMGQIEVKAGSGIHALDGLFLVLIMRGLKSKIVR